MLMFNSKIADFLTFFYFKKRDRQRRMALRSEIVKGLKLRIGAGKNYMELWI